jgi:hypothetical protein
MSRTDVKRAEAGAMNEIARLSEEITTVKMQILRHRTEPDTVRYLAPILRRLEAEQERLRRLRRIVADEL